MIVEIAAEAERELESIGDRIALADPERAVTFVRELRGKCLALAEYPSRFGLVPRYEDRGIRHRPRGNYLIFYRVEQERVVVIHVLHGAMDYYPLLFSD